MMNKDRQKLALDRPATYQTKAPGQADETWSDWAERVAAADEPAAGWAVAFKAQGALLSSWESHDSR